MINCILNGLCQFWKRPLLFLLTVGESVVIAPEKQKKMLKLVLRQWVCTLYFWTCCQGSTANSRAHWRLLSRVHSTQFWEQEFYNGCNVVTMSLMCTLIKRFGYWISMFGVQPCTEIHFSLHGKKCCFRRRLTNDNQEDEVVLPNETFVGDDQRNLDLTTEIRHYTNLICFPFFVWTRTTCQSSLFIKAILWHFKWVPSTFSLFWLYVCDYTSFPSEPCLIDKQPVRDFLVCVGRELGGHEVSALCMLTSIEWIVIHNFCNEKWIKRFFQGKWRWFGCAAEWRINCFFAVLPKLIV